MCIVLATTIHPDYALILLNNRDEFILRPTSEPHWWTPDISEHSTSHGSTPQQILSSRDLQRSERGTWLGITRTGNFAVLTNYREADTTAHPVQGLRSRGSMVTAWLTAPEDESVDEFVTKLLAGNENGGGVMGVGGFSLVCGKLRMQEAHDYKVEERQLEPFAIISNRSKTAGDVAHICSLRGEIYGLSNTVYSPGTDTSATAPEQSESSEPWPKVEMGKDFLNFAIKESMMRYDDEATLVERLWRVLDTDTLPERLPNESFEDFAFQLRHSIFIPPIGEGAESNDASAPGITLPADSIATATPTVMKEAKADNATGKGNGIYGTQRQTLVMVDWDGNVTLRERNLWDEQGRPIARGAGDSTFQFAIEGWRRQ